MALASGSATTLSSIPDTFSFSQPDLDTSTSSAAGPANAPSGPTGHSASKPGHTPAQEERIFSLELEDQRTVHVLALWRHPEEDTPARRARRRDHRERRDLGLELLLSDGTRVWRGQANREDIAALKATSQLGDRFDATFHRCFSGEVDSEREQSEFHYELDSASEHMIAYLTVPGIKLKLGAIPLTEVPDVASGMHELVDRLLHRQNTLKVVNAINKIKHDIKEALTGVAGPSSLATPPSLPDEPLPASMPVSQPAQPTTGSQIGPAGAMSMATTDVNPSLALSLDADGPSTLAAAANRRRRRHAKRPETESTSKSAKRHATAALDDDDDAPL
ncbi:uncharacterized protein MONBRDRAFT_6368 [Monosiga brevicollis MX1]|uniref:Uncharacterized protein n=1 Tax=Monosiga brevicollis TaxID=81824 RepID=A9UTM8_MONBE|nr:uncharacterized protein MONBRDRAFT_6368 [Monosiga brevicollis MX1]EDQ91521.1 predicted protein [Monosiga brevicollis MX1]|eukprot:XP_001743943.1 hypothetical protein [Monosiga brevicollis MX1]